MQLMYLAVLFAHSWLRWIVLLLGLLVIVRAISGAVGHRPWTPADDRRIRLFSIALDVQMLLGLVLYFLLSPITKAALSDFGGAMGNSAMRFWAAEHVFGMIVGVVLVHRGASRVRGLSDSVKKHRIAAVFFTLAMVAILASIPWPGTPNARVLFRW
jgi:hypothetical protein